MKRRRVVIIALIGIGVLGAASGMTAWRSRTLAEQGRLFNEGRLFATLNVARAFAASWFDEQQQRAQVLAGVSLSNGSNVGTGVDQATFAAMVREIGRTGEIVGARLLRGDKILASAGAIALDSNTAHLMADSAEQSHLPVTRSPEQVGGIEFFMAIAIPVCVPPRQCVVVILEVDGGKRFLKGIAAMRGAAG